MFNLRRSPCPFRWLYLETPSEAIPGRACRRAETHKEHRSKIESFDRDMPIRFLPIKWEKFPWNMEAAGIEEAITFEFSNFITDGCHS